MKYAVTGAAGHVGLVLCNRLLRDPATKEVRALDINFGKRAQLALPGTDHRLVQLTTDVRDAKAVKEALAGCDAVFHLAAYGMSGGAMLEMNNCVSVNVGGTANVLDACQANGIRALVYTSTYNVVFSGQREIQGGDETTPTPPLEEHTDAYAPSKCAAEGLVVHAAKKKHVVATCALRPAAIYGPEEQRHLPRIASFMRLGLFRFTIGAADAKVDWLHVENFVDAQLLAVRSLLKDGLKSPASGETFFISDGQPVNHFEFLRPLAEETGASFPSMALSVGTVLGLAGVAEQLHTRFGLNPVLTRAEVYKCGQTHFFSIAKAQKVLGYKPLLGEEHNRSMRQAAQGVVARAKATASLPVVMPEWFWWPSIFLGFYLLYASVYTPEVIPPVTKAMLLIFKTPQRLEFVWYLAWVIHVVEALWAWAICVARGRGWGQSIGWAGQTLLLGFPSLTLLMKQEA